MNPTGILAVVAHPDDELLWFGAALRSLALGGVPAVAISLTCGRNAVRSAEFSAACARIGARAEMFEFQDGGDLALPEIAAPLDGALNRHADYLGARALVITHPAHGNERGHLQHRESFAKARAWAHARGLPFAVFSERPLDFHGLGAGDRSRPVASFKAVGLASRFALRQIQSALSGGLKIGGGGRVTRWKRDLALLRSSSELRYVVRFPVDLEWKAAAIRDCYPSQSNGVFQYETATAPYEFASCERLEDARWLQASVNGSEPGRSGA